MRGTRDRIWDGRDINKLCIIDGDINTDMYISELRVSEEDDETVLNINNNDRVNVNRSIYGNGHSRILRIIRGGIDTDVLYNRGMRGKGAKDNSGILFFHIHIIRISINVNKYNVYIYDNRDNGLRDDTTIRNSRESAKSSIHRICSKFSGKDTNIPISHMITISACGSTGSRISITSGGTDKIRELWADKIWARDNTDGE